MIKFYYRYWGGHGYGSSERKAYKRSDTSTLEVDRFELRRLAEDNIC